MPPLAAPGMPIAPGAAAAEEWSLLTLLETPAKEWYWCSPRCLWRSNWSCIWSCWSCWEELDEELEDAERLTPDNCDSSSAMGSPEETSDSRTVAWTGWWWTLAVRLALALPEMKSKMKEKCFQNVKQTQSSQTELTSQPAAVPLLLIPPPRECGTRRTPAPDRDGSSRNDIRSLWPVERCSRLMCVEKSDQVRRWLGSPPGVEAHIGQITSWESCDESECADETWSASVVSVYPKRPQKGHVRDCGCTMPAVFLPE